MPLPAPARLRDLVLLVALAWAGAVAADEPPPFPSVDQAKVTAERTLQITMMGQRAGSVHLRLGTLPDGRRVQLSTMSFTLTREGVGEEKDDVFSSQTSEAVVYADDGSVALARSIEVEAGVTETTTARYRAEAVDLVVEGPGGTHTRTLALPAGHADPDQVFRALRAEWQEGRQPTRTFQDLDESEQRFKRTELTLEGRATFTHGGVEHAAWRVRSKDEDGLVMTGLLTDDGLPCEMSFMGGMAKARWEDGTPTEPTRGGWRISSEIAVDHAVPEMLELEQLEVRLTFDPPPAADLPPLFVDGPQQTVTRLSDGYDLVLRHGRPARDAAPLPRPLAPSDPDVARFLTATPQAQSDHPAVREMAARITKTAPHALAAVQRIVGWTWAHVAKESGARGTATAVEVLAEKKGDCTEHATLVVALCRAAGVPARAISGIVYLVTDDGRPVAGYHAWAEAWVGRWIPVDATIPEIGTSARYLRMGVDEPGEARPASFLAAVASSPRLAILAYKHFGAERVQTAPAAAPAPPGPVEPHPAPR